ncbi:predicted protein [Naegleria gruberi]|uniref:ribose-phosphate diphosphokinase n=1 Tax=Naegleria gruberi TaxID=5762 RepID=D2VI97_NAEGR|nr:uncharacterized protein NAEGRDRAFT_34278 [Naegleria gruberi]EFC43473.1 predicted protein [Naegleria gruberi]|eukprot:XP_002676217.1 predicted protein [Naegleria gruberi strain NEG-M]
MGYDLKLISCSASESIAENIAQYLDVKICKSKKVKFADGECYVQINENVRGSDAFVVQSMSDPVNDNFMEMLLMIDALKRSSVNRINVVITYYAYARQDRKTKSRVPISAALLAKLIEAAGADHVVCVDLHAGQIEGYFSIPVDNVSVGRSVLSALIRKVHDLSPKLTIVSPDAAGGSRADVQLQYVTKHYEKFGDAQIADDKLPWLMELVGEVNGRDCIIVDDIVDTAGTLCSAAKCLKEQGATRVFACVTHGLLNGPALQRINDSPDLDMLIISNTVNQSEEVLSSSKIMVVDVSEVLGETIRRIHNDESLNNILFQK